MPPWLVAHWRDRWPAHIRVSADQSGHAYYQLGEALPTSMTKLVFFQPKHVGELFFSLSNLESLELDYENSNS